MNDVLLLTVDALRADHVGCLGYERDTTPTLDRLSQEAVVYEAATATGPGTPISVPSIVTENHAFENPDFPEISGETLAERFSDTGYRTAAIASNPWIGPTYGYDRGFDDVAALGRGPESATSRFDEVKHAVADLLGDGLLYRAVKRGYDAVRQVDSTTEEDRIHEFVTSELDRPGESFVWAHYMTTHTPYTPDPADENRFVDDPPDEESVRELARRARQEPKSISADEHELIVDLYDSAIRHVDRRLDDLLDAVDMENTVVCITADHGDAFAEHGYYEHPQRLHQELIHVPLFLLGAGHESRRIVEPVNLDAIADTLGSLSGAFEGSNRLPPLDDPPETVWAAASDGSSEDDIVTRSDVRVAVRDNQWKLVDPADGDPVLFDLAADPAERDDRSDAHADVTSRLQERAEGVRSKFLSDEGTVPDELEDRLQDLGYLE